LILDGTALVSADELGLADEVGLNAKTSLTTAASEMKNRVTIRAGRRIGYLQLWLYI
jgi:hypothetical protein